MQQQLEIGKAYVTRSGSRAVVISLPTSNGWCVVRHHDGTELHHIVRTGSCPGGPIECELIDEWDDIPVVIRKDAPRRTECPTLYRVRTLGEVEHLTGMTIADPEYLAKWGGRTTDKMNVNPLRQTLMLQIDGDIVEMFDYAVEQIRKHTWHDNGGLLRSWCTCCNADADWDRSQYKYVERKDG